MRIGRNHDEKTGCINDFLWDKAGIDICMRAAFLCDACKELSRNKPATSSKEYKDVLALLAEISAASHRGLDVLNTTAGRLRHSGTEQSTAQVFLCHNSADKAAVRKLNEALKNGGVVTWLDEEQIKPGELWQDKLEATIGSISSCLIIVGDSGLGPWQNIERRAFITEFLQRGCKVVPVLVGSPSQPPELPLFLKQFMWVDLRNDDGRNLAKLFPALRM